MATLFFAIPTLWIPFPPFPHLTTKTGTTHLLSDHHYSGKAFKDYVHHFGTPEVLVVVLEADESHLSTLKPYLKTLVERLEQNKTYVKGIRYRLPV